MAKKVRSTLTFKIEEKEDHLFALFNMLGRKGDFYDSLYKRLGSYFNGEIESPIIEITPTSKASVLLWFDLDNEFQMYIRSKLQLCNYSDETRGIIKEAILEFGKTREPGGSYFSSDKVVKKKTAKKAKVKKTPKKEAEAEVGGSPKVAPEDDPKAAPVSVVKTPKLAELTFDESKSAGDRIELLRLVLSKTNGVSPGGVADGVDWAKTLERYLSGKPFKSSTAEAFEDAEDDEKLIIDYMEECPYLSDLHKLTINKRADEADAHSTLPVAGVGEVEVEEEDLGGAKPKDFTKALLGMTLDVRK